MTTLAIDPGPTHSAYIVVDENLTPIWFDKIPNEELLKLPHLYSADHLVIEQVAHYGTGMPAGKTVFDTCIWIGRFIQARNPPHAVMAKQANITLIPRTAIKTHICGQAKANDANLTQALIDRFAPGVRNHGKGVKNEPGFFYGFHSDIWQSFALAVYFHDTQQKAA